MKTLFTKWSIKFISDIHTLICLHLFDVEPTFFFSRGLYSSESLCYITFGIFRGRESGKEKKTKWEKNKIDLGED